MATAVVREALPALTSRQLYDDEASCAEALHVAEQRIAHEHHAASIAHQRKLHEDTLRYDTELFVQDMLVDVGLAVRDATRDAIRHSSQSASSFLMCNALMLNCVFMLLTQWNLPQVPSDDSANGAQVCFGFFSALISLSLLLLLGSVILCLKWQKAVTAYDISKPLRRYQPCDLTHEDYNSYLACHCYTLEHRARAANRLGCFAVVGGAIAMGCANLFIGRSIGAGPSILFAIPCGVGGIVVLFGDMLVLDRTRAGKIDMVGMMKVSAAAAETSREGPT